MERLRILCLEDSPLDAELVTTRLEEAGFECALERVETRDAFLAALQGEAWDMILADYSLPAFDGVTALKIARETCPELPFIFVSGALGEELAIETLKGGATDYVLKARLERLAPSVRRALREREERAQRRRLEQELCRRAEELAAADRRKDEFLAMLSHELRNPLAPIRTALELMRRRETSDPVVERARAVVERQVGHMTRLVDDLLDVSRITQGKIELRTELVDLAEVIQHAVQTCQSLIEARQHELSISVSPEPLWLEADATRMEQLVTNLLNNAAKFTEPGGRIGITAQREGSAAVLRVRDTGVGLAPELLPHVFDLFTQADRSLDRSQGGLGIGLTLARRLVELHGGSIAANSAGPGQGSEFVVRLPLRVESPELRVESAEMKHPTSNGLSTLNAQLSTHRWRVLIVEDNADAAQSLAELIEFWGHEVRIAADGPAALQTAAEYSPELVLLDIGLPGMDGYEIARRLWRQAESADTLLVAVTGYGQDEDRRRAEEAGFDRHLTKPVHPDEIQRLLAARPSSRGRPA